VRRGWRVLVLVAVPLLAGVVAYTQTLPDEYEATAVVSFAPRPDEQVGADVLRVVLPKYEVYAEADSTIDRVANELGFDPAAIKDSLQVSIPLETSNVQIGVSSNDRRFTAAVANAIASEVVDFSDKDRLLEGSEVSRAQRPTKPSGPPRRLLQIAGGIAALLAGAGAMLVVDRLRPVVRTAADATEATELRLAGMVPRNKALRGPPLEAIVNRRVGPAIRNLRAQVERTAQRDELAPERGLVLVVTSSVKNEGKSNIAALYALASTRVKGRVLLIDADLLRPGIARLFRVNPSPGVAQLLRGGENPDAFRFLREGGVPNLSIMPTTTDRDAGDLVSRKSMESLLAWASSVFDLVVVDSPPILGNEIGPTIAGLGDAVLFVTKRGTRTTLVEHAIAVMRGLDANLIGVVANGIMPSEVGYYA